jgi:hypothetical protein
MMHELWASSLITSTFSLTPKSRKHVEGAHQLCKDGFDALSALCIGHTARQTQLSIEHENLAYCLRYGQATLLLHICTHLLESSKVYGFVVDQYVPSD